MKPHKLLFLLLLFVTLASAHAEEPRGFDRRGFYLHGSWVMEHPFAVRSWTRDDMARMFRLLRHLGFNHVMLWPTPEVAPMPLSDEDTETLRSYRSVIDDAHALGLKIWLTYCPTVISTEEVRGVPWSDRSLYATTREVRLTDEETEQAYLMHRSAVLRLLDNADAFVVIDGDPGGYKGAPLEEYLRVLTSDQRAVPGKAIIPWIWSGWGRSHENGRFWETPIAPLVSATYSALMAEMPANWEVMPGRSHREDWANGRTAIALAEQAQIIPRCTMMCYEIIEFEPTPPASVLQFDLIRNVLRQESKHAGVAKGLFGNAQQPVMVLPNLYFFARAAADLRYLDRVQEDVLADLARELGGDPKVLVPAWSCLELPLEKLPADLVAKIVAQRLDTDFAKCIPGGPRRYVEIMAAQVQSRRQLLEATAFPPNTAAEAAIRLADGAAALIRWWHLHHYVGRGKKGDSFRWEFLRTSEVNLLRDFAMLCRHYGDSPFEQAAVHISNEGLLGHVEAAERLNELSPAPATYASSSDVLVYTATAGGVTASVAAALEGTSVVLLEPGQHLGGMLSSGFGHFDGLRQKEITGGLAIDVYQRIAGHYGKDAVQDAFDFEPHVAEQALKKVLMDAGVRVVFGEYIDSVTKDGARITSIKTQSGSTFSARVFIDAGYEGDLVAKAGVGYTVGRENQDQYGESPASQAERLKGFHCCFRPCLTDRPENMIPITKPEQYNAADYELLRRYFIAGSDKVAYPLDYARLPNGKVELKCNRPISSDLLDTAREYPEATIERRDEIWEQHRGWTHGLIWFLQSDEGLSPKVRDKARRWGLCKDEFIDTNGWPHQLSIHEGRRMVGETVVTQHDLIADRTQADSIGMCDYVIGIQDVPWVINHPPDFGSVKPLRIEPRAIDQVVIKDNFSKPVKPWQIPYRAILPKSAECDNLLVPVCSSMSTIANASFHTEPVLMIAGQAAGTAAGIVVRDGTSVQTVDIPKLQAKLREHGQILEWTAQQTK